MENSRASVPSLPKHSYWFDFWLFLLFDVVLFVIIYFIIPWAVSYIHSESNNSTEPDRQDHVMSTSFRQHLCVVYMDGLYKTYLWYTVFALCDAYTSLYSIHLHINETTFSSLWNTKDDRFTKFSCFLLQESSTNSLTTVTSTLTFSHYSNNSVTIIFHVIRISNPFNPLKKTCLLYCYCSKPIRKLTISYYFHSSLTTEKLKDEYKIWLFLLLKLIPQLNTWFS